MVRFFSDPPCIMKLYDVCRCRTTRCSSSRKRLNKVSPCTASIWRKSTITRRWNSWVSATVHWPPAHDTEINLILTIHLIHMTDPPAWLRGFQTALQCSFVRTGVIWSWLRAPETNRVHDKPLDDVDVVLWRSFWVIFAIIQQQQLGCTMYKEQDW